MKVKTILGICSFLLLLSCSKSESQDNYSSQPKCKCVYGPAGAQACVKTTEDDCLNNFNGSFYPCDDC